MTGAVETAVKRAAKSVKVCSGFTAGFQAVVCAGHPVTPDVRQDRLYVQRNNKINRQGQRIRTHKMWGRC
jgi:bifunctional N-acetylglucosamine-1-phosphate-uridyltransferase/glucosamine-1-phosphate-acetyltransferase GlmU-like protein